MNDKLNEVLKSIIDNVDKVKLQSSMSALNTLLSSVEGKLLLEKIKLADKDRLSKMLGEIKAEQLDEKMGNSGDILKRAAEDKDFINKLINALE